MGMIIRDVCPRCKSPKYKKNGHIHNGKQNHQCKDCGRQFVDGFERNSYRFHEVKVSDDEFEFSAEPSKEMTAGDRSYNITHEYVLRYREGTQAPRGSSGTPLGQ